MWTLLWANVEPTVMTRSWLRMRFPINPLLFSANTARQNIGRGTYWKVIHLLAFNRRPADYVWKWWPQLVLLSSWGDKLCIVGKEQVNACHVFATYQEQNWWKHRALRQSAIYDNFTRKEADQLCWLMIFSLQSFPARGLSSDGYNEVLVHDINLTRVTQWCL